jgi:RNA polymerase sigma-70 factor (ECF subfamily)
VAWERLVRLYAPLVYRWCRAEHLQAADAADVGQEVFQAVAQNIGGFRRDQPGHSFRAWVSVIARHKIVDHRRRRPGVPAARGGSQMQTEVQFLPDGRRDLNGQAEETRVLFRRAVDLIQGDFEEKTWRAFLRVVVDGASPADVAAELELTVNAVYLAKARVLRRLREEFADLEDI